MQSSSRSTKAVKIVKWSVAHQRPEVFVPSGKASASSATVAKRTPSVDQVSPSKYAQSHLGSGVSSDSRT